MIILNLSTYKPKSGGLTKSAHDLIKMLSENDIKIRLLVPKRYRSDFEEYELPLVHKNPFVGFLAIIYDPIVNYVIRSKSKRTLMLYDGFWPLISFCTYLITVHDLYFLKEKYSLRHIKRSIWLYYWKKVFQIAVKNAFLIRSISSTTTQEIQRRVDAEKRTCTVYHRLNTIIVNTKRKESSNYAIHIGNLIPRKNIKFLVEVFSDFKDRKLFLVGNNMIGLNLKDHENITITGFLNSKQKESLLKISSLLVTASHEEGFCYPIYEALAIGIPVLAPDVEIFKEFLPTKYLYKKDDKMSFNKLFQYIRNNRNEVYIDQVEKFNDVIKTDEIERFIRTLKPYEA